MEICWQYQIRTAKHASSSKRSKKYIPNEAKIQRIEYGVAKDFILEYEWLGNMGSTSRCFGLYLHSELASVVCFSPPVSNQFYHRLFPDQNGRIIQLSRGATSHWSPGWVPSKLLAACFRILANETDSIGVTAYADPKAGEIGTIYQACNAIYLGLTKPAGGTFFLIGDEKLHPRTVYRRYGTRDKNILRIYEPGFTTVPILPKHRYFFPIGTSAVRRSVRRTLADHSLPYPKRPSSVAN